MDRGSPSLKLMVESLVELAPSIGLLAMRNCTRAHVGMAGIRPMVSSLLSRRSGLGMFANEL
ncbi:hypothetical protein GCM10023317_73310 [Actinopolymorpha pittospori]